MPVSSPMPATVHDVNALDHCALCCRHCRTPYQPPPLAYLTHWFFTVGMHSFPFLPAWVVTLCFPFFFGILYPVGQIRTTYSLHFASTQAIFRHLEKSRQSILSLQRVSEYRAFGDAALHAWNHHRRNAMAFLLRRSDTRVALRAHSRLARILARAVIAELNGKAE